MTQTRCDVLSCVEHERLEFELLEVRTLGQYLTRLRSLTREVQAGWNPREQKARHFGPVDCAPFEARRKRGRRDANVEVARTAAGKLEEA